MSYHETFWHDSRHYYTKRVIGRATAALTPRDQARQDPASYHQGAVLKDGISPLSGSSPGLELPTNVSLCDELDLLSSLLFFFRFYISNSPFGSTTAYIRASNRRSEEPLARAQQDRIRIR